jgi:hypothetical protein
MYSIYCRAHGVADAWTLVPVEIEPLCPESEAGGPGAGTNARSG